MKHTLKPDPRRVRLEQQAAAAAGAGRLNEAAQRYRTLLEQFPGHTGARVSLGKLCLLRQQDAEAEAYLKPVPSTAPERGEAVYYLCLVYGRGERWAEAEAAAREAVQRLPAFAPAHEKLGAVLLENGRHAESVAAFRQAIALGANGPTTRTGLAKALHYQAKFDPNLDGPGRDAAFQESVRLFEAAVADAPENAFVRTGFADLLFALDRFDDAAGHYRILLESDPHTLSVVINYGLVLARIGSPERKALLASLGEEHLYPNGAQALDLALALARTCPHPQPEPVDAAVATLRALDPDTVQTAAWWQAQLDRFNPETCPDLVLRSVFTRVFAWSIPTREAVDAIAAFVDGAPVGSYGAGNGYWESLLRRHHSLDVRASDLFPGHRFLPMERVDFHDARPRPEEVVMVSWVLNDSVVESAVLALLERLSAGQKLVLIGDRPDPAGRPRACASPRLFGFLKNRFMHRGGVDLPHFAHCHDGVDLYVRR